MVVLEKPVIYVCAGRDCLIITSLLLVSASARSVLSYIKAQAPSYDSHNSHTACDMRLRGLRVCVRESCVLIYHYYAALLPRRGPHIASHSVCLSVRLSVCPSVPLSLPSVTWRHLANYNDTHVLFGTR